MREIKFRGKRLNNGEWVYGDLYHTNELTCICDWSIKPHTAENFTVDPATVGQFTGLFDKNGNDIYEGDAIQMWLEDSVEPRGGRWHRMYVVFAAEKGFALWGERMTLEDAEPLHEMLQWKQCEIVGNIHGNPELLKSE